MFLGSEAFTDRQLSVSSGTSAYSLLCPQRRPIPAICKEMNSFNNDMASHKQDVAFVAEAGSQPVPEAVGNHK